MVKRLTLLLLAMVSMGAIRAQSDLGLAHSTFASQGYRVNPSILAFTDVSIGLPLLGASRLSIGSNAFRYRNIVQPISGSDSLQIHLEGFLDYRAKRPTLFADIQSDWLHFGWLDGHYYFNAFITERIQLQSRFRKELFELAVNGNAPYAGTLLNIGDVDLQALHFREYGFSASRNWGCYWRAGLTLKALYGMEAISMQRSRALFYTDPQTYGLTGVSDIALQTSGTSALPTTDSLKQAHYLFQKGNWGWSIDLGASYKPSENWEFRASMLDIGRIAWTFEPVRYAYQSSNLSFQGIPLESFLNANDTLGKGVSHFLDSLAHVFKLERDSQRFKTRLPAQMYLQARYTLNKTNDLNMVIYNRWFRGGWFPAVSAGITKRFGGLVEFNTHLSYQNRSVNWGTGFTFHFGLSQIYLASDNLPGWFGQGKTRNLQLRAGVSFVADYEEARPEYCDRDRDGVPDGRDRCPDQKGAAGMHGCPDTDTDGIIDLDDACPLAAGTAAMLGCPDTDGDGLSDREDACPERRGPTRLKGCPDTDNDGIGDAEDRCPELAGIAGLLGCPDNDGDSIPDPEDPCPLLPGPKAFQGCPDQDQDGIPDHKDACPYLAGPITQQGCPMPDRDGDGIADAMDRCPDSPGKPEHQGCPELQTQEAEILRAAFESLEFERGKAEIRSESYPSLRALAALLKERPEWRLHLHGHTDNQGNPVANLRLSEQRAEAVKKALIQLGVDAKRIEAQGFGQTRPLGENATEAGRQRNRRVEFIIQN